MSRGVLRFLAFALVSAIGVSVPAAAGAQRPVRGVAGTRVDAAHASIWSERGVARIRAVMVATEIDRLFTRIGHDLDAAPPRLQVRLFSSHVTFARALHFSQRTYPQSSTDNSSAIERGMLLLGPLSTPYLRHNLAHVYTEWTIDRLTGNRTDALPSTPWLYDGLAEYEAYRYEPAGMRCTIKGHPPLDITTIQTARRWLELRAGPLGSLEYCLAYIQTRAVVDRVTWSNIERSMHHGWVWSVVAHRLLVQAAKPRR